MIDLNQAIQERHSVRAYEDIALPDNVKRSLKRYITELNEKSGLHMELITDEPKAFSGRLPRYGSFRNVKNYIAIAAKKNANMEEAVGYYGEKVVLYAQQLGLNTCWVGLMVSRGKIPMDLSEGEKIDLVIALGYGVTPGKERPSKKAEDVVLTPGMNPSWFNKGVEAALKAPTAVNQQKFRFKREGNVVEATTKNGFYTKQDLGIAKLHFEIGAGKENFTWKE